MTSRFKGLYLIERVPEEIQIEIPDIVQETVIKTTPKEKKHEKAKWLSEEAFQIPVKRREGKSKGEKEMLHLNAAFQRIARRDKKAFLSDQGKEIEENNRIGKTRDLFKKIRDTKGIFHAKMGTIKDRNGTDLIEAEDIKRRWPEYSQCKGYLNSLQPRILLTSLSFLKYLVNFLDTMKLLIIKVYMCPHISLSTDNFRITEH